MHDEPGYAPIARMRHRAFEQRAPKAPALVRGEDRKPDFGEIAFEGQMRYADKRAPIVVNSEYRIVIEVDSVDVGSDDAWRKGRSEP